MKRWTWRVALSAAIAGFAPVSVSGADWSLTFAAGHGAEVMPAGPHAVQDDQNGNLLFVTRVSGLLDDGGGDATWIAHTVNGDGKVVRPSRRYAPAPTKISAHLRGVHAYNDHRVAWFEVDTHPPVDVVIVDDPYAGRTLQLDLPRSAGAVVHAASGDGEGGLLLLRVRAGDPMPRLERHVPVAGALQLAWATPMASCAPGTQRFRVLGATLDIARDSPAFSRLHVFGFCDARPLPGDTVILGVDHGSGAVLEQQRFDASWAASGAEPLAAIGDGAWLGQRVAADCRRDLVVLDAQFGESALSFDSYAARATVWRVPGGALLGARLPQQSGRFVLGRLQCDTGGPFRLFSTRDYPAVASIDPAQLTWTADLADRRVAAFVSKSDKAGESEATMLGFAATGAVSWTRSLPTIDPGRPVLGLEPWSRTFVLAAGTLNMRFGSETVVIGHRP